MARSDFAFFFPFRIRYSEIDGQKIVFNAHYLTFFDTAITEFLRQLRAELLELEDANGYEFHTVRNLIEYQAPIYFDEEIEVGVRIGRIGRSSLTFMIEIHGKGMEDLRSTGEVVWVNTDQATRKTVPVPELLRDLQNES